MKALVLCAGYGRRLGELCRQTPKPLLPLGERQTIVEHILSQLHRAGFREVFLNLHYKGEAIAQTLGDGRRYGLCLSYLREPQLLGTAGALVNLLDQLGREHLLVHYGDIVTLEPLGPFARTHEESGLMASILVHQRPGSNSFAYLDEQGRITQFLERPKLPPKNAAHSYAFSGICALSPKCVRDIVRNQAQDLPRDVFPELAKRRSIRGVRLSSPRIAVDSPARLTIARDQFACPRLEP